MNKNYQNKTRKVARDAPALVVPERVTVALNEIAADVQEGLLALAVGAGLQVMQAIFAENVAQPCGAKGRHDPERAGYRHGTGAGSVTLGGRRVPVTRPPGPRRGRQRRARAAGVRAVLLDRGPRADGHGSDARRAVDAALPGRPGPVGAEVTAGSSATSRSAVSRKFVAMTQTALADLLSADLSGLDLVAFMVDGVYFAEHLCVVALGIDITGGKHRRRRGIDPERHRTSSSGCRSGAWT